MQIIMMVKLKLFKQEGKKRKFCLSTAPKKSVNCMWSELTLFKLIYGYYEN